MQPKDLSSAMKRAAGLALKEIVPVLDRQFTEEIQTVEWGWPGTTKGCKRGWSGTWPFE